MKSLLNKTLVQFLICAIIIFLLATPLFYYLTKHFYAEEMIDMIKAFKHGKSFHKIDIEKDIIQGVMIQFFIIFSVLSFALFITVQIITRRIWHPFNDTLKKMEHYNLEQNAIPQFTDTNIKEFSRLNQAALTLIKKNRESYIAQKEFTENASHELQTPLAIIQTKLDLLLRDDLTKSQSEIIGELYQACNRMSRLNKNLLLLARIENSQYKDMIKINAAEFINDRLYLFNSLNGKESSINFTDTSNNMVITANEILFESMLNNLVVNAIRNTPDKGCIFIILKNSSLSVMNRASDGALDKELIFRRFRFTSNKKRGNGLGLAIVKAICNFHGWTIDYSYKDNNHIFNVRFFS